MKYASVCSGIEAATVAWKPLGWEPLWFSEVEPFCCSLLKHHYPGVPNLGDITKLTEADLARFERPDILVGGTPCQSFSVAGLRKGLDDPRGNLALRFLQIAGLLRPRFVVWENVPGVLSSGKGRDFGSILGALGELGYGFAYRILDAQYFGVPQRRRRVFVVGCLGDWRRAAAVLLERESLCGHPPPSREAGAGVARPIAHGTTPNHCDESQQTYVIGPLQSHSKDHGHAMTTQQAVEAGQVIPILEAGTLLAFDTTQVTSPDNYSNPKPGDPCHPLAKGQHPPAVAYRTSGNCGVMEQGDRTAALNCNTDPTQQIIAYDLRNGKETGDVTQTLQSHHKSNSLNAEPIIAYRDDRGRGNDRAIEDVTYPLHGAKGPSEQQIVAYQCHGSNVGEMGHLRAGNGNETGGVPFMESSMAVRRLTPMECERLQGFPDNYTRIPYRNKPAEQCPDGPRYRALGNSMAVPVMRWLGERIDFVTQGERP